MAAEKKTSPNVESRLRHNILKMPQEVYAASGIVINGRRLKSFVFTTDLAIIRNCDADAVFAVYPSRPSRPSAMPSSRHPTSRCSAVWAAAPPMACVP